MLKFGWDSLKRLLASDNVWTGAQTFNNISILDGSIGITYVVKTADCTLTDDECNNTILTNYGQSAPMDITLSDYAGRRSFTAMVEAISQTWSFKPPSGETFLVPGLVLAADDEVDVTTTEAGMRYKFNRIRTGAATYQWLVLEVYGTASDGGAS